MNTLRTASGREIRSAALHEHSLPIAYDAALLPGARVLAEDGQIYESMKDWVSGAYEWKVRAQGEPGPALELQQSVTHLQWRVEGSTGAWTDLVALVDITGPAGPAGPEGPQGAGLSYRGSVATVGDLPTPSTLGYAYLVEADDHLWIYNGTAWLDAGPIQGPPGPIGPAGDTGPAGPAGADGAAVQLQKTTTEIQWRLVGATTWITLVLLDEIQGPVGDQGPAGATGASFAFQGNVATVGDLPSPSTTGHAYLVQADGNLYIFNGVAWVSAGPLQGPPGEDGADGADGATGPAGPVGPGFSFQGSVATVGNLPSPSTTGHAYLVQADGHLYVYNGVAWVDAGPLQGPPGDTGPAGPAGPTGPAGPGLPVGGTQNQLIRKSTSGTDYATEWFTPVPETVGLGTSSTPQFAALGLGTAAVAGWELTAGGGVCQVRRTITAASGTYTLDVQEGNEFVTAAAINGATTINLSNLNTIPAGYVWRGVLTFSYTSGVITWFSGLDVKWDGGFAPTPTPGETESVVITVFGVAGTVTTIEVVALQGRT